MFGIFKHYKGKYYLVLGIAKYTENPLKEFVVYKQLYPDYKLWVRPKDMFLEEIIISSKQIP